MNPPLNETQREFFSALLKPLRGRSRQSTDLPTNQDPHDPTFLATADRMLRHSPTLLPAECLELYHRQYWFRILDSLEEDFPGLIRLIGKDTFWQIAENYLLENPSRSFTLRHLGSRFAEFLRKHLADPTLRRRAVAVAEIECAQMAVFEAADAEALSPERIAGGTSITLHPAVILLSQQANAADWLHDDTCGWQDDPFHCAVWRTPTHGLRHTSISPEQYLMLNRIHEKPMTLHQWLAVSEHEVPDSETLTVWFSDWRQREWLVAPTQTPNPYHP